jgi:hypothetical protein
VHDNAPALSSGEARDPRVTPFTLLSGLASADALFPKLQTAMKGTRFEAVSSIQQAVTRELKAMWEEAFSRAFYSLYK